MDDFLLNQDKRLLLKQQRALKNILKLLTQTRLEVIDTLANNVNSFKESYLLNTLRNIDILLEQLKGQMGREFQDILSQASDQGVEDQTKFLNKYFKEKLGEIDSNPLFAPVELIVLNTLEMNVNEFLGRFALGLRERVKNTIQQSLIHGRTETETIQLIRNNFETEAGTTARAVHHIYQTGYNIANFEVIKTLAENDDAIEKQWYSMMDRVTTNVCRNLHLQVQPIEKPFEDPTNGARFMYPPAVYGGAVPTFHFCRSRVIPYIKDINNG